MAEEVNDFLGKVDEVSDIIKQLARFTLNNILNSIHIKLFFILYTPLYFYSTDSAADDAINKADKLLEAHREQEQPKGKDRMIINKDVTPQTQAQPPGPSSEDPQMAMLKYLERDAEERAMRRKRKEEQAQELKLKGNEEFKKGNYESAADLYNQAIKIDPGNILLYTNSAQAYLKLLQFEKAIERCDFALRIDENCVKAHLRKGLAKRLLKDYDEAIRCFKTAQEYATQDQKQTLDDHIQETDDLREIAKRENQVEKAISSGAEESHKLKAVEEGVSVLLNPTVSEMDFLKQAIKLTTLMDNVPCQDLFRLRKGTRLISTEIPLLHKELESTNSPKCLLCTFRLLKASCSNNG
jgi:tetratricopeptide (TPR) repeat protein